MNNVQKRCQTNTPDEGKRLFSKQPAALSEQRGSGERPSAGQRSLPQAPGLQDRGQAEALVQNPAAVCIWKAPTYTVFATSLWSSLLFSPYSQQLWKLFPDSPQELRISAPSPAMRSAASALLQKGTFSWAWSLLRNIPTQEVIARSRGLLAGLRPARSREGPGD